MTAVLQGCEGYWPKGPRAKPWTNGAIKKQKCVRCGGPGAQQWQICADNNQYRVLCLECDIALNKLVLEWARHPYAEMLGNTYESSLQLENA